MGARGSSGGSMYIDSWSIGLTRKLMNHTNDDNFEDKPYACGVFQDVVAVPYNSFTVVRILRRNSVPLLTEMAKLPLCIDDDSKNNQQN